MEREKDQKEEVGGSCLNRWHNGCLKSWRRGRLNWWQLNTGMLKDMSHKSPVLSLVCQELLLKSVLTVLNSLKHG
jgi:hypothetical protein